LLTIKPRQQITYSANGNDDVSFAKVVYVCSFVAAGCLLVLQRLSMYVHWLLLIVCLIR